MKPIIILPLCALLAVVIAMGVRPAASGHAGGPIAARVTAPAAAAADIVIADFEEPTYGDWTATGTAFERGPALGDLPAKLEIENFRGRGAASSEIDGDRPTGTLTSPAFRIERRYISFLIGGGEYERHTCLNLLVDGKIFRSATGWNSDRLVPVSWDVSALAGRMARVQLVDEASGDWGHINVDHIVQTDKPQRLPVVTEPFYGETFRPQYHFTARQWTVDRLNPGMRQEGWLNDLNGLIYYDGEYHLFAQRWNKCWIHAVSHDLIHWTELEPAFWEEKLDAGVQSGTCVIDYENTSGLSGDKATPPMVAFWSRNDNHSQCISYSLDHGRSWKLYDRNPILDRPERDPKVFWHAASKHWVMMLYGDKQYHVLTSANLLDWKDEHNPIRSSFECPDAFELPVDGDGNAKKWVLIQGNGKYSIGQFDGTKFTEETDRFACDIGPNFYATQTWANTETGDGRRIQCAWMRGGVYPNMPFNQQVSFPCELTLHTTPGGLRLFRAPIREIALLHKPGDSWADRSLDRGATLPLEPSGDSFHILADVAIPEGARLTFNLCGATLVFTSKTIESGSARGALPSPLKTVEILVDRTSIEAFVNGGEVSTSRCFLPDRSGVSVKADDGSVVIQKLVVYPLESALNLAGMALGAEPAREPQTRPAGARDYLFDGKISREVLENYLSRSVSFTELLHDDLSQPRNRRDVDPRDNIRFILNTGAKFVGRALMCWGRECELEMLLRNAKAFAAELHKADPEIVLQGAAFEIVTRGVETVEIPEYVLREFGQPVAKRNFSFDAISYPTGTHRMGPNGNIPDMNQLEARMWFYYLCTQYIDAGIEAIHFGQIGLMDLNDRRHAGWLDVLGRVRAYARQHARRHFVICDAHTPNGGYVEDGRLLFDVHSFPLRICEVPDQPLKGCLRVGYLDSLFTRSKGGITPSGWSCEHLPFLVEFDNFGGRNQGKSSRGTIFAWGYDEITWFSVLPEAERNAWLGYAWKWIAENDPNGHLEMPGSRVLRPGRSSDGPRWYWANTRSEACPDGSNTEQTIKEIWAADSARK